MGTDNHNRDASYVLLTAAHNEEAMIEKTLESVVHQNIRPNRWVIVSDNSTDRTDEIIGEFAQRYDFIEFVKVTRPPGHSFAAKILALREGYKRLDGVPYEFIGNLDADISLEPSYFQELLKRIAETPSLGIVAGYIYEEENGQFRSRGHNRTYSPAHGAQLVRRECYEAIGGYAILRFGGEDTHAAVSARMKDWQVESFPDLKIYHQRHTGGSSSRLVGAFRQGQMEYDLGYDVLFEILKCTGRMMERPFLLGGLVRMLGFVWPYFHGDHRVVKKEFVAFVRGEQRRRLWSLFDPRRPEPRI
jgi:biofilm PGA synthesis N-glycosyltransferase PgaC